MDPLYRNAFGFALLLHLFLAVLLVVDSSSPSPALSQQAPIVDLDISSPAAKQHKPIEAVNIDARELNQKVLHIKQKKEQARQAAVAQQENLEKQWEQTRQKRIAEERKLAQIKAEAARKARQQKEKARKEQQRLAEMARQKAREEKKLAEMARKKEALRKEQEAIKRQQLEQAKKEKEAAERKARKLAEQKRMETARQARMQSEKDKYKALIIQAISQQWILPENVDNSLSSQFQIRLGPDGTVLDVRLVKSSGDAILDRSAQTAIYKASPVPVPGDRKLFEVFRDIRLTVRPENIRG